MSYSDFTLEKITKQFGITIKDTQNLFADVPSMPLDAFMLEYLAHSIPLAVAIGTEKAKSELIVAPMLLEVKTRLADQISLFSGVDFSVDVSRGLHGVCDFIISRSQQQFFVSAPVIVIVEAKKDDVKLGLPQAIAAMIAASAFNAQEGNSIETVFGAATSGNQWKFMQLQADTVTIDVCDYYIADPERILGVLHHMALSSA